MHTINLSNDAAVTTTYASAQPDQPTALHVIPFLRSAGGEPLHWSADTAALIDRGGSRRVRLRDGVLSFNSESYADNFGWQWNQYATTQFDSQSQESMSEDRLLLSLGVRPQELRGKYVLEAGCGAGRFTEVLLKHGAIVCAFDASSAVYANARSNQSIDAAFMQASIYDIPVAPGFFDIVLCLGVLQHTPDPARTIRCLADQVRPGGLLCVDSYPWFWHQRLALRYLIFRPIISRLPAEWIRAISTACVSIWWPFRKLLRNDWVRRGLSLIFPANVPYYYNVSRNKSDEFLKQWALLDTHDFLSPRYDKADSRAGLASKLRIAGLNSVESIDMRDVRTADGRVVSGFFVGRGRKPA